MTPLKIRINRISNVTNDVPLPTYATVGSAGMDIYAAVEQDLIVKEGVTLLVPTGFSIEVPLGYEAQIRPRSGLALKHNIGLMNSPGTIDSDYRGEVKIVFTNYGKSDFVVKRGDRIAQMIIAKYERVEWIETDQLSETERGSGGFGHTGISQ
ncbi:MAG TPA: dUTP diphosphatase [Bacteroidetes bacterium]|nr:dUTP diphosphatase [Bacteroidota bacterium]